jgi:hypothetical protein
LASADSTRYIAPETLFRQLFGEEPRPAWAVAVLSVRGDPGPQGRLFVLPELDRRRRYGGELQPTKTMANAARDAESVRATGSCGGARTLNGASRDGDESLRVEAV